MRGSERDSIGREVKRSGILMSEATSGSPMRGSKGVAIFNRHFYFKSYCKSRAIVFNRNIEFTSKSLNDIGNSWERPNSENFLSLNSKKNHITAK